MRYTRLISWTLFVLFFLVYLTAIKMVRGNNLPQQHFIQQIAPLYNFQQPYQQLQQTVASQNELDLKRARDFGGFITFEQSSPASPLLVGSQEPAGQLQYQPLSRRHQLPAAPEQQQQHFFGRGSNTNSVGPGEFSRASYHEPLPAATRPLTPSPQQQHPSSRGPVMRPSVSNIRPAAAARRQPSSSPTTTTRP